MKERRTIIMKKKYYNYAKRRKLEISHIAKKKPFNNSTNYVYNKLMEKLLPATRVANAVYITVEKEC